MKKAIITAVAVALLVVSAGPSLADEASHREAALRLLELSNMSSTMDQVIEQTLMMEIRQAPQLALYHDVMKKFFRKYLGWESLKEDFAKIYMDEFTEDEIRDIIVFYETPTGQKTLEKAPVLFIKGAEIGQNRVQENIAELQSMIEEETVRLRKLQEEQADKEEAGTSSGEDSTDTKTKE